MGLFSRSKVAGLTRLFSKLPGFSRPDRNSLIFLNIAQFMGVLNDNIFKLVIAFLLIDIQGAQHASAILSTAGAIFVIPFLLFSSAAGILADRFSKQRLMIVMKMAEITIMTLALFAFGMKSVWGSYILLFLLSTHSAMFGPSKYAIISELVPSEKIPRANGLITSFTYLGIIVGTFLASFVTEITHKNFIFVAGFCLIIAGIGFVSVFGIQKTPAQGSSKRINPLFIHEIIQTLRFCKTRKHLLIAITGAAYFLFIGAFTQLNIIPFGIDALGLTEIAGGYLFLSTALGIACGAYIAGKVSKNKVELGLSCVSGFAISFLLFLLWLLATSTFWVITLLVLLGVAGGMFIVPFDSFVQVFSPDEKRGQIIAANNFLSFCGVLVASFALYFYSQLLDVAPASGFAFTGLATLLLSFFLISRLSDYALPYIARTILKPFIRPKLVDFQLLEKHPKAVVVLPEASWSKAFLLFATVPKIHLVIPIGEKRRFPWFNWVFYSVHIVRSDPSMQAAIEKAEQLATEEDVTPCLFIRDKLLPEALQPSSTLASLFTSSQTLYLTVDKGATITVAKTVPKSKMEVL